jgi:hypothetical protein
MVARGAAQWRDRESAVRTDARRALRDSQWSPQVIEAALDDVLADLDDARAAKLARTHQGGDTRPVLVLLPGNVIGPAIASAYCAALTGSRVILKASSDERNLAVIVARQFDRLGPPLAGTIDARYWRGGDEKIEEELFAAARRLIVFGSDATCEDVRQRAASAPVEYADAYSLGFVCADADVAATARDAARDICMFDQRGCMSPQTIYVEGDDGAALLFAQALARALDDAGRLLPRGKVQPGEAAHATSWIRQLSVTALASRTHGLDTLLVGPKSAGCPSYVVAVEAFGAPKCIGFGRMVVVMPCSQPPPHHRGTCDTIGFAGPPTALLEATIRTCAPARACALGEMQRPPLGYRPSLSDFA